MADEIAGFPGLEAHLARHYDIPVEGGCCKLIRHGFNHTYHVAVPPDQYIFRIYLNRKYYISSENDFRFELEWLRFLRSEGLPVAHPIPARDGQVLGALEMPGEEVRYCALFSFAEGEQKEALTDDEARELGATIARVHAASGRFACIHSRYHLNLEYLTEQPLQQIDQFLRERGREGVDAYLPRIAELEAPIRRLPTSPDAYGLIHGDLHLGNIQFTSAGSPTLFDFDHSGYGWRAYDLATCVQRLSDSASDALLRAYDTVRPLLPEERESIPFFQQIRPIWDAGDILAMRAAWNNHADFGDKFADDLVKRLERL